MKKTDATMEQAMQVLKAVDYFQGWVYLQDAFISRIDNVIKEEQKNRLGLGGVNYGFGSFINANGQYALIDAKGQELCEYMTYKELDVIRFNLGRLISTFLRLSDYRAKELSSNFSEIKRKILDDKLFDFSNQDSLEKRAEEKKRRDAEGIEYIDI